MGKREDGASWARNPMLDKSACHRACELNRVSGCAYKIAFINHCVSITSLHSVQFCFSAFCRMITITKSLSLYPTRVGVENKRASAIICLRHKRSACAALVQYLRRKRKLRERECARPVGFFVDSFMLPFATVANAVRKDADADVSARKISKLPRVRFSILL